MARPCKVVVTRDKRAVRYWAKVSKGGDIIACVPDECIIVPSTKIVVANLRVERRDGYVIVRYGDDTLVYPNRVFDKLYDIFVRFANRREPYPRGVLLIGPPGTGKTQLVKILSILAGVEMVKVTVDNVLSKYIGESERNLRRLLTQKGKVILLDDFEWLARPRALAGGGMDNVLAQEIMNLQNVLFDVLQTAHDEKWHVLYVATTNAKVTMIDPALRRAGRFDIEVYVPPLDFRGLLILCRELGLDKCEERVRKIAGLSMSTADAKEALKGNIVKRSRGLGYKVYTSTCPDSLRKIIERIGFVATRLYLAGPIYLALPLAAALAACFGRRLIVMTDLRKYDDVILAAEHTESWLAVPSIIDVAYQFQLVEETEVPIVFFGPEPGVGCEVINAKAILGNMPCVDACEIIKSYYGVEADCREVCRKKDVERFAREVFSGRLTVSTRTGR